jgi:hypothetical protein
MKKNVIRIVVMEVACEPRVKMIKNTLEAFQAEVGGLIEPVEFHRSIHDSVIYVNEEGLLESLPLNCVWNGHYLHGNLFISKSNEEGENVGLTEEEAQKAIKLLTEKATTRPPAVGLI